MKLPVRLTASDLLNIAQLLLGLIGFAITIISVIRSKNAAQRAEEAAIGAKDAIIRSQTLADFAAAITMMDEIKRLHRVEAWNILPERYAALRAILIAIQASNPQLPNEHVAALQGAIKHFSDFEAVVERSLSVKKDLPNPAKFNSIVSVQVDRLNEILIKVKQDIKR